MKRLAISALAVAAAAMPGAAFAGGDSVKVGHGGMHMGRMPINSVKPMHTVKSMGGHHGGRWVGGHQAPGGWNAYRRPMRGYVLPRYWIQPSFFIPNYSYYGLSQPSYGYGWSRYYNDAVLTDRYGRVYDSVSDLEWDDAGGYDGGYDSVYGYGDDRVVYDNRYYDDPYYGDDRRARGKDRDGGLGGALIGGAAGALAGGLIAKRGDNTAGALIGGGLGAIAGAAIDAGDRAGRGPSRKRLSKRDRYDDGYGNRDPRMDFGYGNDGDRRAPRLDYEYGNDGDRRAHWGAGASYPAPQARGPIVTHAGTTNVIHTGGGYGYGYGYGQPTVTTVIVQPAPVTKTVTTTTEYETVYVKQAVKRVAYKPAPKRTWKPKPKPRCVCKVVYR